MYPSLSDYLSATPLDFDRLRSEIVAGLPYQPSFGAHQRLDDHLGMLEGEFVGQNRLKFVHAALIVLIRRGIETDIVYGHFCRLWADHADILLDSLDSRWLVSACDTICDFSPDPAEARIAVLLSLFTNTLKLVETERRITGPANSEPAKIVGRTPIFDGMTAFLPVNGNMVANLLQRLDKVLQSDTRVEMIGRELISRALSSDTVFRRLARFQTQNIWPNWLALVPQPALAASPRPRPVNCDADRACYILLNDTGRLGFGFHMGTVHACNAIRQNLARRGLVEVGWANDQEGFDALLASCERKPALVVLNGEGTLHHDAPRARSLLKTCERARDLGFRVAVVNSVWQENSDVMGALLGKLDAVHVRDSLSLAEIPADIKAQVTPDVSIHLFLQTLRGSKAEPMLDIAVMDSVVPSTSAALLTFAEQADLPFYAMPVGNLRATRQDVASRGGPVWPRLLQATDVLASRTWVTGRFHGLIAALCAGRPVCALPSNTSKVEGFLQDFGLAEACLLGREWISAPVAVKRTDLARRFDIQRAEAFVRRRDDALLAAAARIDAMFDSIADLAR